MSKLVGRRVVIKEGHFGTAEWGGMVGTIVEIRQGHKFPIRLTFYGHDRRPLFLPSELRYLNNREVKL